MVLKVHTITNPVIAILLALGDIVGARVKRRTMVYATLILTGLVLAHFGVLEGGMLAMAMVSMPAVRAGEVVYDRPGPTPFYEVTNVNNFDGMTSRDYLKYFKDGIKNARQHQRWDTRIWAPATTIAVGTYDFFAVSPGADEPSLDGGTVITKTDYLTNMQEGKKLERGSSLIVDSLQIEVVIPHREFNAFSADLSPASAAVTSTDTSSATAHMLALDRAAIFELWRGNRLLAEGSLSDFPCAGGFFGAFGGATPEGYIQNGLGEPNYLREIIVLQEGYLFKLKMRVLTAILSVLNVEIRPRLCGVLVETVG